MTPIEPDEKTIDSEEEECEEEEEEEEEGAAEFSIPEGVSETRSSRA